MGPRHPYSNDRFSFLGDKIPFRSRTERKGPSLHERFIKIREFDRFYTIQIQNPGLLPQTLTLFGANQFLYGGTSGIPAGIILTVLESSYAELLQETETRPFVLGGMVIDSTNIQLQQPGRVFYRDSNGVICSEVMSTFSYFSVNQYQNSLEIYPIRLTVTGETQIQYTVLPLTTVTLTLYVKERLDAVNELSGKPTLEVGSDMQKYFSSDSLIA